MRTTRLFGLDFLIDTTIGELAEMLAHEGRTGAEGWRVIVTPNVDHLVRYRNSPSYRHVAQTAHWVLADGAPIIWASRLLRSPITRRLAGSDLFAAWWQHMCVARRPVLVVAGNDALADRLRAQNPACRCIVPPQFADDDPVALASLVDDIMGDLRTRPADALLIGLSMPKHHAVAARLIAMPAPPTGAPFVLLLGAAAEFHVGLQRRAPAWMQRTGTEWLYRLLSNPRRMARRYLVDDMAFFPMVWREWRARRTGQQ